MNQKTHLRNEVELSPKRFLAESSTKGGSAQDLRPKFQPIYHGLLVPVFPAPHAERVLELKHRLFKHPALLSLLALRVLLEQPPSPFLEIEQLFMISGFFG